MGDIGAWVNKNKCSTLTLCLTVLMALTGLVLIFYGVYFILEYSSYDGIFSDGKSMYLPLGLFVVWIGIMIVIASVMGCIAIVKEDLFFLRAYWVYWVWIICAIIFLTLIFTGPRSSKPSGNSIDKLYHGFKKTLTIKYAKALDEIDSTFKPNTEFLTWMEIEANCCGVVYVDKFCQHRGDILGCSARLTRMFREEMSLLTAILALALLCAVCAAISSSVIICTWVRRCVSKS